MAAFIKRMREFIKSVPESCLPRPQCERRSPTLDQFWWTRGVKNSEGGSWGEEERWNDTFLFNEMFFINPLCASSLRRVWLSIVDSFRLWPKYCWTHFHKINVYPSTFIIDIGDIVLHNMHPALISPSKCPLQLQTKTWGGLQIWIHFKLYFGWNGLMLDSYYFWSLFLGRPCCPLYH